jgi:iron complex outermembrane receptor protein
LTCYPASFNNKTNPFNNCLMRMIRFSRCRPLLPAILGFSLLGFGTARAQGPLTAAELKRLSIDELMNMEVSLVTRSPQRITEAASAVQVVRGEDIRRSGATNLAEALRLVSNLQVAQITSSAWIISSRGFSTIFSNKLLVMIDGRTVYTPLFGGVIWELQQVLLEDVSHIEVVSGPGGSLWGANAVNGIINIVTKKASGTQGLYAMAAGGNQLRNMAALRYGTRLGNRGFIRTYVQHADRKHLFRPDGTDNDDSWRTTQAGFRMDWESGSRDAFTFQGDLYTGNRETKPQESPFNGQNLLARWNRTLSEASGLQLQVYFDRFHREDLPFSNIISQHTVDADFQHFLPLGKRQHLVWGAGYRLVRDDANYYTRTVGLLPRRRSLDLVTAFVQDEISLTPKLKATIGTKLLHNVYTGVEAQPSLRLAYQQRHGLLWAAVSRAVRTPSRFDRDYFLPVDPQPPNRGSVAGGPNFVSEKVMAYELGYRLQPAPTASLSVAGFYNRYIDLYSVENLPNTLTYQIQNGSEGSSWGLEFSGAFQALPGWRLRGGYTFFDKDLRARPGRNFDPDYLGNDVKHQALLQSVVDLPFHLQFDLVGRYLGSLSKTLATSAVPSYFTFDARLAYQWRGLELALVGQNLGKRRHAEFRTLEIPRSYYAKISARF